METVKIGARARGMALDEKTPKILVPFADQGTEMGAGDNNIKYLPDTFRVLIFGQRELFAQSIALLGLRA